MKNELANMCDRPTESRPLRQDSNFSIALKFIMVTVSKDVFSHKGRQIKHILVCHNGLVYSYKTKINLIFPQGIL